MVLDFESSPAAKPTLAALCSLYAPAASRVATLEVPLELEHWALSLGRYLLWQLGFRVFLVLFGLKLNHISATPTPRKTWVQTSALIWVQRVRRTSV